MNKEIIKSISYNQDEIIRDIIRLHCKTNIELDPCYSKGVFYKSGIVKKPIYKFDIDPISGVEKGDCRSLPLADNSISTMIFDPPFLATTGKSLRIENENNKINKRFGVYKNESDLYQMYFDSLDEFGKILKPNGILIFKCQDKVSSGKQYWMHIDIVNYATKIGYKLIDMFILLSKSRIVAQWQVNNQKNARKYHSYFLVFKKI
ncbi:TRM11 family methyltransferase [Bacteroides congonensis]|uniref:hypothetical protein n=1 Tax=Bacteroides congonensis TaxID=1871006 RepID=UPI00189B4E60|nr:hypothetical protein [Bacteroides congonensis]